MGIVRVREEEMTTELIKIGMSEKLASDLSFRYYNNEITLKDLEFLKLELTNKIDNVKMELKKDNEILNTKLDNKFEILESKIYNLDKKIDDKIDALDKKIDDKIDALDKKIDDKLNWKNQILTAIVGIGAFLLLQVMNKFF